MSNRGGLRLGFGGKRTKRAAKKSEGTHLTPRKDEPLTVRCAKSLAEALSEQSDDVEEWGAVVCSWPAAALERPSREGSTPIADSALATMPPAPPPPPPILRKT